MRKYLIACLIAVAFVGNARAVTIAWTPIGNPGNANDATGFGAVPYNYNIGTYDVTNSQYAEFLNTKDPTGANTLGLWDADMANAQFGGINFNAGNANGNKYTLIPGTQNHPVSSVTWYDTIRFANWLNNGQETGDTETGAYTLLGGTPTPSNGGTITRNAGASVFLPSENEWYKAAYYDPRSTAQGGPPPNYNHYWQFPTSSNSAPIASAPTALANHANYNFAVGNLTDVGAYSGTTSPYGAFDMGGDVYQWNETKIAGDRGVRGDSFNFNANDLLAATSRKEINPAGEIYLIGFRVAELPEPSTLALAATALAFVAVAAWRRRI